MIFKGNLDKAISAIRFYSDLSLTKYNYGFAYGIIVEKIVVDKFLLAI